MALLLVAKIMTDIGLGNEPSYYAGGSCLDIRRHAVETLPKVIRKYAASNSADEAIAPPNQKLMDLAKEVSEKGQDTRYTVNFTYDAIHDIITTHMAVLTEPIAKRKQFFESRYQEIRKIYVKSCTFEGNRYTW